MAGPHDEIKRIERDLEAKGGQLSKAKQSDKPAKKHRSLDAVIATSGLLVVVAFAIVFGGRLNVTQRAALSGGVAAKRPSLSLLLHRFQCPSYNHQLQQLARAKGFHKPDWLGVCWKRAPRA